MTETYYGKFYGFDSVPFHITPDSSSLLETETHRHALAAIEYGVNAGKGFILVTGEVGVGKTTVLRACLEKLSTKESKIVYLLSPELTSAELYATLLYELNVRIRKCSQQTMLRALQRVLLRFYETGIQVVLAIDEAQNMSAQTLESLRLLSNLETNQSKLLQIILVGQPELENILAQHSLRQLAQRIAIHARITPLTVRDSCRYVRHRIACAGRFRTRPLFTKPALLYLAITARGIPRAINICCDNALINGFGHGAEKISWRIAYESCRGLPGHRARRVVVHAFIATALFGIVSSAAILTHAASTATKPTDHVLQAEPIESTQPISKERAAEPASDTLLSTNSVSVATLAIASPLAQAPDPQATQPDKAAGSNAETSGATAVNQHSGDVPDWKWHVRKGDTLISICKAAYGSCKPDELRGLYINNDLRARNRRLHQGQIIVIPAATK